MPRVSVIMPVYNGEKYIRDSVNSILKQTYQDFELVIINDGSTDRTKFIIDQYAETYPKVKVFHCEHKGVSAAANFGMENSTGEYIARLDSDDKAVPERLAVQVKFLDEHPDIDLAGSYFKAFHVNGRVQDIVIATSNEELQRILPQYNQMGHSTIMMRRSVLDKVGMYDTSFTLAEDYEFYLRVIEKGKIANIPQFLVYYRFHPEQATTRSTETQKAGERARQMARERKKKAEVVIPAPVIAEPAQEVIQEPVVEVIKKKPGRPKKQALIEPVKRGRGRPKKEK